jgi:hypothetical protein
MLIAEASIFESVWSPSRAGNAAQSAPADEGSSRKARKLRRVK